MSKDKKVFKSFLLIMGGAFAFPIVQQVFAEVWNFVLFKVHLFSISNLPIILFHEKYYSFQSYWGSREMGVDILSLITTFSLVVVPIYIYLKYRLWKDE